MEAIIIINSLTNCWKCFATIWVREKKLLWELKPPMGWQKTVDTKGKGYIFIFKM